MVSGAYWEGLRIGVGTAPGLDQDRSAVGHPFHDVDAVCGEPAVAVIHNNVLDGGAVIVNGTACVLISRVFHGDDKKFWVVNHAASRFFDGVVEREVLTRGIIGGDIDNLIGRMGQKAKLIAAERVDVRLKGVRTHELADVAIWADGHASGVV
jgi:hypothetical protein